MSTITTILEPDADGTLHLPLPEMLRHGKMRVVATPLEEDERREASYCNSIENDQSHRKVDVLFREGGQHRGAKQYDVDRTDDHAVATIGDQTIVAW